jgi:hypothetical protein
VSAQAAAPLGERGGRAAPAVAAAAPPASPGSDRWIAALAVLHLEVEAGLRPVRHLRPLLSPELQLRGVRVTGAPVPEVVRVVAQRRPGACEAVVLLRRDGRVTPLAIALRRRAGRWRVTELRRPCDPAPPPSDPPPPPPPPGADRHAAPVLPLPRPDWALPAGWAGRRA